MYIIEQIRTKLIIVDSGLLYLASIPATLRHLRLVWRAIKLYKERFGVRLNWRQPTRFSEKLLMFKISTAAEAMTRYADKYEVRSYVEKTIGAKYLIPVLGVYESVAEIDTATLPSAFVLKATHGSDWNIICPDKSRLDWEEAQKKLQKWLQTNFYSAFFAERQYRTMKPRIICEEYLPTPNGLIDYKFHCFRGKPVFIRAMRDRSTDIKKSTYDLNWKRVPVKYLKGPGQDAYPDVNLPRPGNLQEMIEVATKLSARFPYVRVDLYNLNGKVYFGELTFTPNAGLDIFEPDSYDFAYGALFDLPEH